MGTFCIVFGIIVFIAFLVVGHVFGTAMVMENFFNILGGTAEFTITDFLALPAAENLPTYLVCLIIFAFLGLMIGIGVFMNGVLYNKMNSVEYTVRRAARRNAN